MKLKIFLSTKPNINHETPVSTALIFCPTRSLSLALILCSRKNDKFGVTSELLLWRCLRTIGRHQTEDRGQTSFVLSSIIYLSRYIYLSARLWCGWWAPDSARLLTATATALCGDRGDGVNSWVAATPSPATLGIVHCILHYILHRSNRMYEQHIKSCRQLDTMQW